MALSVKLLIVRRNLRQATVAYVHAAILDEPDYLRVGRCYSIPFD